MIRHGVCRMVPVCILVITAMLIAGCSNSRQDSDDTLRIYSRLWGPLREQTFIREVVLSNFNEESGISAELSLYTDNDLTALAAADNLEEADLVIPYGKDLPFWLDHVDLYDLVKAKKDWSPRTIIDEIDPWQNGAFGSRFLPIGADVYLFIASDLANAYRPPDINEELSWTGATEWIRRASLKEGRGLFAVTAVPQKSLIYVISGMILSYGGGFPDLGSSEAQQALKLLTSLQPGFYGDMRSLDTVIEPMVSGDAWFAFAHCARVGAILQDSKQKYQVFQAPAGPEGRGSVGGVSGLGVLADSASIESALSLAEYLTRPETQVEISRGVGGFLPTVAEAQDYLGMSPLDQLIRTGLDLLIQGRIRGIPTEYSEWGNVKQVYEEFFLNHLISDAEIDPELLKRVQRDLDSLRTGGP